LLEGEDLVGVGIVSAVDHEVGHVLEAVGPFNVGRGVDPEGSQWVDTLDLPGIEVVHTRIADNDGAMPAGSNQDEPDSLMGAQRGDQTWIRGVDLLQGQPPGPPREVNEAETP